MGQRPATMNDLIELALECVEENQDAACVLDLLLFGDE